MIRDKAYNYNTLEPKLLKANNLAILNGILKVPANTEDDLRRYMCDNKTECALAIFNSTTAITYPSYIKKAIAP